MSDLKEKENRLRKLPTLALPLRVEVATGEIAQWGSFDLLSVRAIDDLALSSENNGSVIFLSDSLESNDWRCVAIPSQVALERVFFHLNSPREVIVDPVEPHQNVCEAQSGFSHRIKGGARSFTLSRSELPYFIGGFELGFPKKAPSEEDLANSYRTNQLFPVYYGARRLREEEDSRVGWFYELLSLSFFGLPEEAMALYEAYPHRGAADPDVQLINARYRSLLKQHNEARTLFHAISFNPKYGTLAKQELARSLLSTNEYDRVQDLLQSGEGGKTKDPDAMLILGMALRGIGYPSGDEETLREALSTFESVARTGGFNSPEALFHSGVIFSRLGALTEAEVVFRQSLFQRDRYATREALIRVLATRGDTIGAKRELSLLGQLRPTQSEALMVELCELLESASVASPTFNADVHHESKRGREAEEHAARELLARWEIPCTGSVKDLGFFDGFINYYAPSGQFSTALPFHFLRGRERGDVARAFALIIGGALCRNGLAAWRSGDTAEELILELTSGSVCIPIERFVADRISLGASADAQSNLLSLVETEEDFKSERAYEKAIPAPESVSLERKEQLRIDAEWIYEELKKYECSIDLDLDSFAILDKFFDTYFEPGGEIKEGELSEIDPLKLLDSIGVHVARVVDRFLSPVWFDHPDLQGISLEVQAIGILYPIAKVHLRAFFGNGADSGTQLSSLALGIATAALHQSIRDGRISGQDEGIRFLRENYLGFASFSDAELSALIGSLQGTTS